MDSLHSHYNRNHNRIYHWHQSNGMGLCFGLVLAAEAFNTAIERLVNLVSPDYHPIAGDVKDIAAGAVLICAVTAALVGAIIFIPYF